MTECWSRERDKLLLKDFNIDPDLHRVPKQSGNIMKFPYKREGVFVDQYLNVYEDYQNLCIPYNKLIMSNSHKINMRLFGTGYDMTPFELYRKAVLGLFIPSKMDIKFIDGNSENLNPKNIIIQNKSVNRILEFRFKGLKNRTPQELRLWKLLNKKKFKQKIYPYCHKWSKWDKVKSLEIIEQSLFRNENSFYLVDLVLKGFKFGAFGIELDGKQHYTDEGLSYDFERDSYILNRYGINLKRYSNVKFNSMSDDDISEDLINEIRKLNNVR